MIDRTTSKCAAGPPGIRYFLFPLLLLFWAGSAPGVPVDTLYDAEASVATGEEADRVRGFRDALAEVLVRITGKTDAARRPESREILDRAGDFVEQFRYMDSGMEEPAYLLWVRFDGVALEEAVSQAGLPVWHSDRPAVLVWLAVSGAGDRRLVGDSDEEEASAALKQASDRRGIPVVLPLLDLEDRRSVSVADVAGGFDDSVRQASTRYGPEAVWIGSARGGRGGYWNIDWRLYLGAEVVDWRSEGTTLAGAIESGVDAMADTLGGRLAVLDRSQRPDRVLLEVEGISGMGDYARATRYLTGVGRVSVFRPWRIEPGLAVWLVQLRGSTEDLIGEISLGSTLVEVASADPGITTIGIPVFAPGIEVPDPAAGDQTAQEDTGPEQAAAEAGTAAPPPDVQSGGVASAEPGVAPTPVVPREEVRVLRYRLVR